MLNERELSLAKEYAERLAPEGGDNEEQVLNDLVRIISTVKNVWQGVKETLENITQYLNEVLPNRKNKEHDFNWVVPLKINPPPMPDIKIPKLHLARNNL